MSKFKVSKNKDEIKELEAIDCKANRIPSPPSLIINGKYVNVCPKCKKPCSNYPWCCLNPKCNWTAEKEPELCKCHAVAKIIETEDGEFAYPVDSDHEDSPYLNDEEKSKWKKAKEKVKDSQDIKRANK